MKRVAAYSWALAVLAFALLFAGSAPRSAAQDSGIGGVILDVAGKPWQDIPVEIVSEQGVKTTTKSDKNGKYAFYNLRSGTYVINLTLPGQAQPYSAKVLVSSGQTIPVDFNFKDIVSKQGKEFDEAKKKQEEEKEKFQGMKQHFEAGVATLEQAKQAKAEMMKLPADQRDPLKQNVTDLNNKAITEFEAAKAASNEKDPNLQLIMARLGDAYDAAGRPDDAIAAYKRAIELKPSFAYYNNLGGIQGRAGKIDDASASYQKAAELDPAQAPQAWRNFGITMYNAQKYKEAVDPLKKATELDPKNPQAWYLLGTVLVGTMGFKKVGDKDVPDVQPGTVEAYQHAIELDPNGPWGQQAKQGLDMLQQIAPGIDTRVGAAKKKKS
ncbi:MAG TPA: tetratricopeptide repeat protein [Dongiaceae bacterium]|nr:tetratricopeptide repeat protein [Dongiaceae bacterium]